MMVRSPSHTTLTLPNLIGLSPAETRCRLTAEQFSHIGALLLQARPADPRAVCFLGGALSSLAGVQSGVQPAVALEGDLGADPFLVIAGRHGALALLAVEQFDGFHARIFTDPDLVDRAALVPAQFSDEGYSLDALCDAEAQRAFIGRIAALLVADPALYGVDLAALLPDERTWLDLARALAATSAPADALRLPEVQRLMRDAGFSALAAGSVDADLQRLQVITATDAALPAINELLPSPLIGALRAQRSTSFTPAESDALGAQFGAWAGGQAITAVPLIRDRRACGLLLALSERVPAGAARAFLSGLSALLVPLLSTVVLNPPPVQAVAAPTPSANGSANGNGMLSLAARLSGGARKAPAASAEPLRAAPVASPPPAPAALSAPHVAPSLAQRMLAVTPSAHRPAPAIGGLLEHLSDGVVIVDAQGRLVSFTTTARGMLALQPDARGRSLVESGAWCLAPLFTEALIGELDGPRAVELPAGQSAIVDVIALEDGTWAFVMRTDATRPVAPPTDPATLPTIPESERNESFLANFSNIIRMPLRELRELITQVPAAGNLNEQQSRLIGQVIRLNSELTMLVNELLALGQIRLQTNKALAPLRIDLLVEAAVGTQYAEFGRRGQHVITEIQPGLPRVQGAEEGLGRAVAALIDNAIKYSPAGAQIKVAVSHSRGEVVVSVHDNGLGLQEDELAQVFDPFYRAPSTEHLGVSGRGLGLTITKAVIEQHGGRVWAAGAPGQGCVFAFSLPCV
jgi:signal transduction histidine kinase